MSYGLSAVGESKQTSKPQQPLPRMHRLTEAGTDDDDDEDSYQSYWE